MRARATNGTTVKCGSCGRAVDELRPFCQHCGSLVAAEPGASAARNDSYLALVRADVYRLRRQWDLAEVECGEVLRRDPDNPDAYSVMGDIYRDRGKFRDAIEWYKMALDRNPASIPDRRKLEALIDRVFHERRQGVVAGLRSALSRGLAAAAADVGPVRRPGSLTVMVGLSLAIIFMIALSIALFGRRMPAQPATPPSQVPSGSFASLATEETAAPVEKSPVPSGRASGNAKQEEQAHQRAMDDLARDLVTLEAGLLEHLRDRARAADVNCQVVSVEVEPQQAAAAIHFSMPRLWSRTEVRRNILMVAAELARAATTWDERIRRAKLRCDLRQVGRPDELGMVAEGSAERLAQDEEAAYAPGKAEFDSVWWCAELRPAGGGPDSGPES